MVGVDLGRAPRRPDGAAELRKVFNDDDPAIWDPPPGRVPSAAELFSDSVYDRGAMTLQALRVEVGDATFFRILRELVRPAPLRQRDDGASSSPWPSATRTATWAGSSSSGSYKPGRVGTADPAAARQPAATLGRRRTGGAEGSVRATPVRTARR